MQYTVYACKKNYDTELFETELCEIVMYQKAV